MMSHQQESSQLSSASALRCPDRVQRANLVGVLTLPVEDWHGTGDFEIMLYCMASGGLCQTDTDPRVAELALGHWRQACAMFLDRPAGIWTKWIKAEARKLYSIPLVQQ